MTTYFDLVQDEEFRNFVKRRISSDTGNREYSFPTVIPKLYKYQALSNYAVDDILNGRLTATRIGEFNDLFDGAMHRYGTEEERKTAAEKMWSVLDQHRIAANLSEDLLDHDNYVGLYINHFKTESRLKFRTLDFLGTFISCLSTRNDSTLMWSHYAASNTGICVEYDFNYSAVNPLQKNMVFPVAYSKSPIKLNDLLDDEKGQVFKYSLDAAVLCAALNKADVWKYENEWRLILVLATLNNIESERRIPLIAPALSSIIFGSHFLKPFFFYDFSNEKECLEAQSRIENFKRLLEYIERKNIPISIMVPSVGEYQLCPNGISVQSLHALIEKHFQDNEPENMRYYYVVHDELMELLDGN